MASRLQGLRRPSGKLVILAAASLALLTLVLQNHSFARQVPATDTDLLWRMAQADDLQQIAQPGDLIFRRGAGLWTQVFSQASRQEGFYSHVGIVTRQADGLHVWHAEGDDLSGVGGVRHEPIAVFLKNAQGVAIGKLPATLSAPSEITRQATADAWSKVSFDTKFRLDDLSSAVYCTEYVWEVIRRASGRDIVERKTVIGGIAGITVDDLLFNDILHIAYQRRLAK